MTAPTITTEPDTAPPTAFEDEDELPALQAKPGILKNPDLMIWPPDDDATITLAPPAHIAARFYSNRRRSSAASSRRNSLSSSHSHSHHSSQSHRRTSTSCQSNHVAQHLRRASIIESRKARLADRAAHVEQVRLRAAQAKAAPRTSNLEEKALAAQQAREKYLAKVAAACAEEVSRAKRVAEEWKERKAVEEQKYRAELAEKHAEVEKRRLEHLRTPRKHRAATHSEAKKSVDLTVRGIDQETAAVRLQKAWRRSRDSRVVAAFVELGLSIDRVRECDFAAATELLADARTISSTSRVIELLGLKSASSGDSATVRTFLSAFMIIGHPSDIFNKNGQQEQDLIDKAKDILLSFESLLSRMMKTKFEKPPSTQLQTLSQAYASYLTAFSAWKARDASVLIETMVDQFVALDVIWQTVKDDERGEVANDYRDGIRNNQIMLLSKIKKLAGAERSNMLIKKAIRESRRARSRRLPLVDVRPRPVDPSSIVETTRDSGTPQDIVALDGAAETPVSQALELTELSKVFSIVPPNRALVHELLMDPNFKIEVSPQSDVRNELNREVCESMRRAVRDGQGEMWTVAVAENIRTRLLKLLRPGNSMHQLLTEVLDSEHIRTQYNQGLFSYDRFFTFMADLLPRLCAPIRDAEVKILAESLKDFGDGGVDAMIEKLFNLLHMINVMSLDYTNYMLQQAAPTLIREAPGYEARLFATDLAAGTTTLVQTKRWWRNAAVTVLTESQPASDPASPFARTYARALVDLAITTAPFPSPAHLPETLRLDASRLARIRADMLRFTVVGGILLTAKNLLRRDVRAQWKPEARRVVDSLAKHGGYNDPDGDLAARILAVVESGRGMPASSREHLAGAVGRFLAEARAGVLVDPVLKLLFQRLRAHLFHRLAAATSAERVRVASTASEGLAGIGLPEFVGQIGEMAEELRRVAAVDMEAHGSWYRGIAEEMEGVGREDES